MKELVMLRYEGIQEGFGEKKGFPLYTVLSDGHRLGQGTTLSLRGIIERFGKLPETFYYDKDRKRVYSNAPEMEKDNVRGL